MMRHVAPKRDTDDLKRHIRRRRACRADRLGGLRQGICIVMVVMMHSVLGRRNGGRQTGFMHLLVAFAKPFRMRTSS